MEKGGDRNQLDRDKRTEVLDISGRQGRGD